MLERGFFIKSETYRKFVFDHNQILSTKISQEFHVNYY